MSKSHGGANRQREFFPRSKQPTILIDPNHRLVQLTDTLDWTEMEERVEGTQQKKKKDGAGRPPHLQTMLGAIVFMATRRLTYREAEDQIRYYAPASLN